MDQVEQGWIFWSGILGVCRGLGKFVEVWGNLWGVWGIVFGDNLCYKRIMAVNVLIGDEFGRVRVTVSFSLVA